MHTIFLKNDEFGSFKTGLHSLWQCSHGGGYLFYALALRWDCDCFNQEGMAFCVTSEARSWRPCSFCFIFWNIYFGVLRLTFIFVSLRLNIYGGPLRPNSYIQLSVLYFLLMSNEHLKYSKSNWELLINLLLQSVCLQYSSFQLISNYLKLRARLYSWLLLLLTTFQDGAIPSICPQCDHFSSLLKSYVQSALFFHNINS